MKNVVVIAIENKVWALHGLGACRLVRHGGYSYVPKGKVRVDDSADHGVYIAAPII